MGEDITKTGPVGLKGLNRQGNNTISKEEYEKFISSYRSPESIRDSIKQSHASRMGQQYSLQSGMGDLGDSIYDNDIYNLDELNRVQYIRGENQPGLVQLINGIAKGAGLAATTFIDGTAGFVVGLGTGIYNKFDEDPNTGFISGVWDNPVTRAMQSINEWAEGALPNYYTEDELNNHWSKNILTANFIGDKLIKNLGFAVGAFYSGKAITSLPKLIGAAKLASKVPAGVASLTGSTVSAINEGSIEAINSTKEWYDSNKAILDNSYNQAIQNLERYKGTTLYDVLLKKETDAYNNTLAKLSEDRVKLGNSILGLNLPILLASNIFQFGKAYSKGYKAAKTATSITGKLGNYTTNKTVTKGILKGLSNALTEGMFIFGILCALFFIPIIEELRDLIFEKNEINNSARLLAGYCWDWMGSKDYLCHH